MKLSETITQIRDLRLKAVGIDKELVASEKNKVNLLKTKEAVKLGYGLAVYSDNAGLYKNEKLRDLTIRSMASKDDNYQRTNVEIALTEDKINKLTFEKSEISIEVEYLKNCLRIAEIDLAILKK